MLHHCNSWKSVIALAINRTAFARVQLNIVYIKYSYTDTTHAQYVRKSLCNNINIMLPCHWAQRVPLWNRTDISAENSISKKINYSSAQAVHASPLWWRVPPSTQEESFSSDLPLTHSTFPDKSSNRCTSPARLRAWPATPTVRSNKKNPLTQQQQQLPNPPHHKLPTFTAPR